MADCGPGEGQPRIRALERRPRRAHLAGEHPIGSQVGARCRDDPPHEVESVASRSQRQPRLVARSEERRVGKGVDLGGRRIIKKKRHKEQKTVKRRSDETDILVAWYTV